MDIFERNYKTYYRMLRFTGLWPFDDSILPKIQRTSFAISTLCCILIQSLISLTCFTCGKSIEHNYNASHYLRGIRLSYRIREAVNNAARMVKLEQIDIGPAMEMHQKAFILAQSAQKSMMLSYLLAIVVVVISFAVNLYRASLLMLEMNQLDETIMSVLVIVTHLVVMFLNNYSGQQLANISINVFNETYNSMWYRMPPKSQKMLLLVLMKTSNELKFNLAGLFSPCYEGFTTMMSSSFSYFTVLYSV